MEDHRTRPLTHLFDRELTDHSINGIRHVIEILESRCDGQRLLAERGHWSYDFNHHLALLAALKGERLALIEAMFTSMKRAA